MLSPVEESTGVRGFETKVTPVKRKIINRVLERIEEEINVYTSTPNARTAASIMDMSFPKCFEEVSKTFLQHRDNDSGYVSISHTQESGGFEFAVDCGMPIEVSEPVYISEDALLEKPESGKKCDTECVYEEFSHLYYLNSLTDDVKINPSSEEATEETKSIFGALLDESENVSITSNSSTSSIISIQEPIVVETRMLKQQTRSPSPDIFSDDEEIIRKLDPVPDIAEEKYILETDHKLIKRINKTLSGVLPPPSLTVNHLTASEMLEKLKGSNNLFTKEDNQITRNEKSLLINTNFDEMSKKSWPETLNDRYHGLHYNRSKLSEETEMLCMKYLQRYVGAETQSSCTVFDNNMSSPSKRRASRLRWAMKSPGRRLSHLARRRITFSSANLQNAGSSNSMAHSRQVMVDAKRFELLSRRPSPRKTKSPRKTPRKTPRKSPRKLIRTPVSSSKRNLALQFEAIADPIAGPSTSSVKASGTKRALFQSPEKGFRLTKPTVPSTSNTSQSPWKKRSTPKRALFLSPQKNSPAKKRRRLDSDVELLQTRNDSVKGGCILKNRNRELHINSHPQELSAHHKKKLQWAVYEALKVQNISVSDPNFKQFASVLARVTRRLLPTFPPNGPKPEVGTSERMLRIAKQHVFSVSRGKSVEEIIQNYELAKVKIQKPVGYVTKEDERLTEALNAQKKERFSQLIQSQVHQTFQPQSAGVDEKKIKVDRVRKIINFGDGAFR